MLLHLLRMFNVQADVKVLELLYAKRIQRKQKLLQFCVTKSHPPIYWSPKEPSEETESLLQDHAAMFEEWKQQQLQQGLRGIDSARSRARRNENVLRCDL